MVAPSLALAAALLSLTAIAVAATAVLEIARPASAPALVPVPDQTRTVGPVTLPGAFVGVLFGRGTAVQAGSAQLLVLVGLVAAESVAVVLAVELVSRRRLRTPTLRARLAR